MLENKRKEYNKLFYKLIASQKLKSSELDIINGYVVMLEKKEERETNIKKIVAENKKLKKELDGMQKMMDIVNEENIRLLCGNEILKGDNDE